MNMINFSFTYVRSKMTSILTPKNSVKLSGCGLWDEPFINNDFADSVKLILEGRSDVNFAVKGHGFVPLGKRVPIIIPSNHELVFHTWKNVTNSYTIKNLHCCSTKFVIVNGISYKTESIIILDDGSMESSFGQIINENGKEVFFCL